MRPQETNHWLVATGQPRICQPQMDGYCYCARKEQQQDNVAVILLI
jgi:hypothetical protein